MEGMYIIELLRPATSVDRSDPTADWRAASTHDVLTRYATRLEQRAGSESITAETSIEVTGGTTWMVRIDDELRGVPASGGDPAKPCLSTTWRLKDVETQIVYDIVAVTEKHIRGGERRFLIHTKKAIT